MTCIRGLSFNNPVANFKPSSLATALKVNVSASMSQ